MSPIFTSRRIGERPFPLPTTSTTDPSLPNIIWINEQRRQALTRGRYESEWENLRSDLLALKEVGDHIDHVGQLGVTEFGIDGKGHDFFGRPFG